VDYEDSSGTDSDVDPSRYQGHAQETRAHEGDGGGGKKARLEGTGDPAKVGTIRARTSQVCLLGSPPCRCVLSRARCSCVIVWLCDCVLPCIMLFRAQSELAAVPMALVNHAVGECKTLRSVTAGLVASLLSPAAVGSVVTLCGGKHALPAPHAELLVRSQLCVLGNWRLTHAKDSNIVVCSTAPWYVLCSHCGLGGHFHFDCTTLRSEFGK
jgi:hypothetical protein